MLERKYDPALPYRFARYGRMSDPRQNKRSPDQQFNTIDETIARCNYPWTCVATYRDDGITGRLVRRRPGIQKLLRDVEAGLILVDLIVVDTLERLGRAEEIAELRRRLYVEYGVLVVAADSGFSDPTGVVGKAVGMVEQIRSTENTRIARHNIIRGKKDAARRGRWPGGPPPFGFRLKQVIDNSVTPPEVYNVLEPEPRQSVPLALAFVRAAATGEGDLRLSQWWNANPEIPAEFKPISPTTMGYRLENPIAIGTLRWGEKRTGIVNDTRVIEANPEGPELTPDFCTPIVSRELFQLVQEQRQRRGEHIQKARCATRHNDVRADKLITPQTWGLTLKYLLTGLVRCGCCNASLRPVPSGRRSKGGKKYVYYACPRHLEGSCVNGRHVPEDRLREAVLARLRARLFPCPGPMDPLPGWLAPFVEMVSQERQRLQADQPNRAAAEEEEQRQLARQLAGWSMTLGNPQLSPAVRTDIEARYAESKQRQTLLQQATDARQAARENPARVLEPRAVLDALHHLGNVLAGYNPTLGNLELSKHIDVILCYPDARIEMRSTILGLWEGAAEVLRRADHPTAASPLVAGAHPPVVPRHRGRLHIPNLSAAGKEPAGAMETALDPDRFTGLPKSFHWIDSEPFEEKPFWSEQHAAEVARQRAKGQTHEQLATLFGVSVPTIRKALRIARKANPALNALPGKMPRPRWPEQHFLEVAAQKSQGLSLKALCAHFQRSEPLIREALRLAEQHVQAHMGNGAGEEPCPLSFPTPEP